MEISFKKIEFIEHIDYQPRFKLTLMINGHTFTQKVAISMDDIKKSFGLTDEVVIELLQAGNNLS